MKNLTYKIFEITVTTELRRHLPNNRSGNVKDGLVKVKKFIIKYKGESREEEFKSIPHCKRWIDEGRLSMWVKMINKNEIMKKEIRIIWEKALEMGFKFNESDAHEMWIAVKEFQEKENKDAER